MDKGRREDVARVLQERLTLHLRRGNDASREESVFVLEYSVPSDTCPPGLSWRQVRNLRTIFKVRNTLNFYGNKNHNKVEYCYLGPGYRPRKTPASFESGTKCAGAGRVGPSDLMRYRSQGRVQGILQFFHHRQWRSSGHWRVQSYLRTRNCQVCPPSSPFTTTH